MIRPVGWLRQRAAGLRIAWTTQAAPPATTFLAGGFAFGVANPSRMRTMFIAYWVVIVFGLAGSIVVGLTGH